MMENIPFIVRSATNGSTTFFIRKLCLLRHYPKIITVRNNSKIRKKLNRSEQKTEAGRGVRQ
jgi:hypothetical protein